jgi:hypothetical protein
MDSASWIAAISAIAAFIALFFIRQQATAALAQTKLQQQMRQDQAQPYVWADIRPSEQSQHLMLLVLRNEGPTVATDVEVTFDPPLPDLIKNGEPTRAYRIAGMPPGRTMSWSLGMSPEWLNGAEPKRFTVTVTAGSSFGAVPTLSYMLDVDEYRQASATPPGTLHGITQQLKEVNKTLKK